MVDPRELLQHLAERRGSDLHLKPGAPPRLRVRGRLQPTPLEPLSPAQTQRVAESLLPPPRLEELAAHGRCLAAVTVGGLGRFRLQAWRQQGGVHLVARRIPVGVPSVEQLGLPTDLRRLVEEAHGLVIVAGPGRSGRTATAAALIDHLNATRTAHVATVERPVEVVHADKAALVTHCEVGSDAPTFAEGVRRARQQDADVVLVGELPDPETARAALEAATTGLLVVAVALAPTASGALEQVVRAHPADERGDARRALAASVRGVVAQRLVDRADGRGRAVAAEVLVGTGRVAERIAAPDPAEPLEDLMADGELYGMQTLDQSLLRLALDGRVSPATATAAATVPARLRLALDTAGASA